MKCKDCPNFKTIGNTDECGQGLCSYSMSYFPVNINDECVYTPKEYKCKDCDHFISGDTACMTVSPEDSVYQYGQLCWGFIDKNETELYNILADWKLRGYNIEEKVNKIINDFNEEFTIPWEKVDSK